MTEPALDLHDMSRSLDCGYLAELVAGHRLGEDEAIEVARDLVTTNPRWRSSCERVPLPDDQAPEPRP